MDDSIPANAVANLSQQIPVFDISSVKKFEKAYKWTLSIDDKFTPRWTRGITLVQIERTPLAKGNVHTCYKMHDVAHPESTYIAKFGAANRVSRNVYFNMVIVQAVSEKCAELFNRASSSILRFHPLFVLELVERNHLNNVCVGSPYINGDSKKENVSVSPDDDEYKLTQAFGHYILHKSNNELLVSGLQKIGGVLVNSDIHTKSGKGFFDKNHGSPALQQFAEGHECNNFCRGLKLEPLNVAQVSDMSSSSTPQIKSGPVKINMSSSLIAAAAEKTSEKSTFVAMQKSKYLSNTTVPTVVDDTSLSMAAKTIEVPKSPPPVRPQVAPKYFFPPKSSIGTPAQGDAKSPASTPPPSPTTASAAAAAVQNQHHPTTHPSTPASSVSVSPVSVTPAPVHAASPPNKTDPTHHLPDKQPTIIAHSATPVNTPQKAGTPVVATKDKAEPLREKINEDIPDTQLIMEEFEMQYMQITSLEPSELDDEFFEDDDDDYDEYYEDEILPMPPLPARPTQRPILKKNPSPNKTRHVRWIDLVEFEKTLMGPSGKQDINGGGNNINSNNTSSHGSKSQEVKAHGNNTVATNSGNSSSNNTPNNRAVLTSSDEKLWDVGSFKMATEAKGAQVECICGDELFLYTGSNEGHIAIWDQDLKVTATFRAHNKAVKSVVLNNATLFTGSADASISSWDVHTRKSINKANSKSDIHALCVSEAHSLLFSAENDKTVKVWDAHTLQHVKTLTGHNRAVKALYVMGNYLFSGSNDQQVFIWNLNTHRVVKGLVGHEGWIRTIHALGTTLYTGSQDETVRLWDLNSTECFQIIQAKGPVQALLPTTQVLFSAAGDHVQVWNTADSSYTCVNDLNNRSPVLCMWRKQNQLLCGSIANSLKVWAWE